jgi:thymidylate synthase ThyX
MGKLVSPKVYLVGHTVLDMEGIERYLEDSGNLDFLETIKDARSGGLSDGEILCSMFAKLCYASLTVGKNQNISRVRDIESNIKGCFDSAHLSVFEHCQLNFIVRDCSRILYT